MKYPSVESGLALVTVAAGTPAFAQDFNIQVYGTLLPFVDSAQTSGATTTPPADRPNQVRDTTTPPGTVSAYSGRQPGPA